jgi:hypothetical protein
LIPDYPFLSLCQVPHLNPYIIAYDLPSFSAGDMTELSKRFRSVRDVIRDVKQNEAFPHTFYFSPGGDGGILVLQGEVQKTPRIYVETAFRLIKALEIESDYKDSRIAVKSRVGIHYGDIYLYESADGQARPTGLNCFIADAIASDKLAREKGGIVITEQIKGIIEAQYGMDRFNQEYEELQPVPHQNVKRYVKKIENSQDSPDPINTMPNSSEDKPKYSNTLRIVKQEDLDAIVEFGELTTRDQNGGNVNIIKFVKNISDGDDQKEETNCLINLVILKGSQGAGKTTFLSGLYSYLESNFSPKKLTPLYINLTFHVSKYSLDRYYKVNVKESIREAIKRIQNTVSQNNSTSFILMIDGLTARARDRELSNDLMNEILDLLIAFSHRIKGLIFSISDEVEVEKEINSKFINNQDLQICPKTIVSVQGGS